MAYGEVAVYEPGVSRLNATYKKGKCALTWTGFAGEYHIVLRSEKSPNAGYEELGTTNENRFTDRNIKKRKYYWYRIQTKTNAETLLSPAVRFMKK